MSCATRGFVYLPEWNIVMNAGNPTIGIAVGASDMLILIYE